MSDEQDLGEANPGANADTETDPAAADVPTAAAGHEAGGVDEVESVSTPATLALPDHMQRHRTIDEAFASIPTGHETIGELIDAFNERRRSHSQRLEQWIANGGKQ